MTELSRAIFFFVWSLIGAFILGVLMFGVCWTFDGSQHCYVPPQKVTR